MTHSYLRNARPDTSVSLPLWPDTFVVLSAPPRVWSTYLRHFDVALTTGNTPQQNYTTPHLPTDTLNQNITVYNSGPYQVKMKNELC